MLYSPHGKYIDPSFGIEQRGREAISSHHEKWWNAIPDFRMIAERIYVTDGAVIVQVIGEGTFSGADLAGGKMKATSLPFRGRTCAVLELDDDGKIACCTEYYDRAIIPGGSQAAVRSLGVRLHPWRSTTRSQLRSCSSGA